MQKSSRWDVALLIILFVVLLATTAYSALQQEQAPVYPAGSTYSSRPDGTRALKLWLEELGYTTSTIQGGSFFPDETIDALLILRPHTSLSKTSVTAIERWIHAGGTLVYADDDFFLSSQLLVELGLRFEWLDQPAERLDVGQPLLDEPPVRQAHVKVQHAWQPERDDYVAHVQADGKPVLISWQHGQGQVFAITTLEPFTNAGLKDAGNAALVYNLALASAGRQGRIAFDEYHHGFQTQPSIGAWLTQTRLGWGVLYAAAAVFIFILIGGRRFGQPVPLPEHMARRTTAEYIQALASLKRRVGRRQVVLAHYKDHLKRRLGRAWRVDASLPDSAFVSELAACRPDLDQASLARLLAELSRQDASERAMVRLARQAARFERE